MAAREFLWNLSSIGATPVKASALICNAAILALLFAPVARAGDESQNSAGATERHATERHAGESDSDLEHRVKAALKQDERVGTSNIDVSVKGEVVYLSGTVDTRVDRDRAVEVASNVEGVRKVEDKVTVSSGGGR